MIVGTTDELTLELAAFLCARQESIIAEWLEAVHRDEHIPASESITAHQLRDHLPMMFNDLADTLRSDVDPEDEIAGHENAITHGHHRWEQGYQLEEVLRELARVRVILLEHILRFEEQQPEFRGEVRRIALRRLYFFFDQMVTRSAAQFVHEQQADLRARNQHLRAVDDSRLRLLRISAHDLRNSLNAAHLSAEVLAGEDDPAARREEVTALARSLNRTTALLNDLLTFSTLFDAANSPRKVSLRLGELFAELVEEFR